MTEEKIENIIIENIIIIGSGPAGYTAAIYASRALLHPILLSGPVEGGQMTITTDVENYPGFANTIQGPWLMEQMKQQALSSDTRIIQDKIEKVDFSNKKALILIGESNKRYLAKSVIIACGAKAKWLGLASELRFRGHGVSACAVCDGFFFRGRKVAVIGGGNTALEEALYLAKLAEKVTIIHRRDQFRGEKSLQKKVFANNKIKIIWNHQVKEIIGESQPKRVKYLQIQSKTDSSIRKFEVDGIFIAIGHQPSTEAFVGHVEMFSGGYIKTMSGTTCTSVAGVFAAGDVADSVYRQAVTAGGFGCMAALDAEKYLSENH